MGIIEFKNIVDTLDYLHKQALIDIMTLMKHECNPVSLNDLIYKKINERMQELGISKTDLFNDVQNIVRPIKKTKRVFDKYFERKSIEGELLAPILFALGITADDNGGTNCANGIQFSSAEVDIEIEKLEKALDEIKKEYSEAQQTDGDGHPISNVFWLYETLSKPDQSFVEHIARILHTLQPNPDVLR